MKRLALLLLGLSCLLFSACALREHQRLDMLEGAFEADVEGTFRGVSFAGKLCCEEAGENDVRTATFTFYAPRELAGTCVIRDETGGALLTLDGMTVRAPQAYGALLTLFSLGSVSDVVREREGTRIVGEGFSLLLNTEGTPVSIENGEIAVRVLSFLRK